jgi:hypothetical protein
MNKISFVAVVIAFSAEMLVDQIIGFMLVLVFGQGAINSGMSEQEMTAALKAVTETSAFLTGTMIFGTATTVGGGYLAARIARQFPYYNGLAMGLVGLALQLYLWRMNPLWMNIISVITVIPMSIWGAHIAKPHLPPPE